MTAGSAEPCGWRSHVPPWGAIDERQEPRQPERGDDRADPPNTQALSSGSVFRSRALIIGRRAHGLSLPSCDALTRPWSRSSKKGKWTSIDFEHHYRLAIDDRRKAVQPPSSVSMLSWFGLGSVDPPSNAESTPLSQPVSGACSMAGDVNIRTSRCRCHGPAGPLASRCVARMASGGLTLGGRHPLSSPSTTESCLPPLVHTDTYVGTSWTRFRPYTTRATPNTPSSLARSTPPGTGAHPGPAPPKPTSSLRTSQATSTTRDPFRTRPPHRTPGLVSDGRGAGRRASRQIHWDRPTPRPGRSPLRWRR